MIPIILVFGGPSAEHEVSVRSARSILAALDRSKYHPFLLGIERNGDWRSLPESFLTQSSGHGLSVDKSGARVVLCSKDGKPQLIDLDNNRIVCTPEIAFSIVHGTYGEDGSLQGLFRMQRLAFVGPSVLGSSLAMDKALTKAVLKQAGIAVAAGEVFWRHLPLPAYHDLAKRFGSTLFVKPANAGSSIGVSKVTDSASFDLAVKQAFQFDNKLLVEAQMVGRELECAVLGNENPRASGVAEIIPKNSFYSYQAKYLSEDGAEIKLPAVLDSQQLKLIQQQALASYQALNLEGLSRVDFFLCNDGQLIVNEVNTLPGFTSISMYPKLWEQAGVSYSELITNLLELAVERAKREQGYSLQGN